MRDQSRHLSRVLLQPLGVSIRRAGEDIRTGDHERDVKAARHGVEGIKDWGMTFTGSRESDDDSLCFVIDLSQGPGHCRPLV